MESHRPWQYTFLGGGGTLARYVGRPVSRFVQIEAASGVLLVLATVAAMVWANAWPASYHDLWHTEVSVSAGSFAITEPLGSWISDGLMVIFFFVVGLEIKRELVVGDLRDRRHAVVPAVAAVGGMLVPALLFTAVNAGGAELGGWAIAMPTDLAFVLGVVALFGRRVPSSVKLFLLTLAIVDDVGTIIVIALFYGEAISLGWLAVAVGGLAVMATMRWLRIWAVPLYVAVGVVVWLATFESGVEATLAGVVMGLLAPARPLQDELEAEEVVDRLNPEQDVSADQVREVSFLIRESVPVAERLENMLHPYSSYVIVSVFALANIGIALSAGDLRDALTSRVTLGIVLGRVVGKPVGIVLFALLAARTRWGELAAGLDRRRLVATGALAGIGFTVSLFVTGLAYGDGTTASEHAKIGILLASVLAAGLGAALFARAARDVPRAQPSGS